MPRWLRAFLAPFGLGLLVAAGVADGGWWFSVVVAATAGIGFGLLFRLFPAGMDFAVAAANGFAFYACLFTVIGRSAFPDAPGLAVCLAFLLPVAGFLLAVGVRRAAIRRDMEAEETPDARDFRQVGRWILMVAVIASLSLSLPANRLSPMAQGWAMIAAMTVIAVLCARAVRALVRLLLDIAQLMNDLGRRALALLAPIAAYVSLFSLVTIVFACVYRFADGLSRTALFAGPEGPIRVGFRDALHFSVVTLSTVGYGDIWPMDDGVRLLAAAEVVAGQVLLLFGFFEITRSRLAPDAPREEGGDTSRPG
ncbi:potassium channel family protein [Muricoccus radiodurans]|uniref:potassium channel family protein n=1 Tax=Muricoccus radiodurans TaxID=2231721 RepID=UPI003CE99C93